MLNEFKSNEILLAYYAGSVAYDTKTNYSDTDIIVVLDDINGVQHIVNDEKNIEYYVFGKEYFIQKMAFAEEVTPYLKMFNDDILSILEPIKIDDSFKDVYEQYKNRSFETYASKYLSAVIDYYSVFLESDILKKNMYHLYRIEEQIRRYQDTKEFIIQISDEVKEKITVFRQNYADNNMDTINELKGILEYLKGVYEDVRN